jgi:hypothetical protein
VAFTDAAQFTLFSHHRASGVEFANTFGLYCHDSTDPVTAGVLLDFLQSAYIDGLITDYKGLLSDTCTLDSLVARRCFDPQDPTDPAPEASRTVDEEGLRSSDGDSPLPMCILMSGHTDTASRRARSHKFLPPALDSAALISHDEWNLGADYYLAANGVRENLQQLLYTAGGEHAGGAAGDFDLATYSLKSRQEDLDNYLFRWTSISLKHEPHWLRSRGPHG